MALTNWSGTHLSKPTYIYGPRNEEEVAAVLREAVQRRQKLRAVGTALSPNGIAMNGSESLLSLSDIDYVVCNPHKREVTVGAGATVRQVLSALAKEGLTLENFSSIQEQQMAGWTQVAAHGTGCKLPTVEEQIVHMKIVTPGSRGAVTLSINQNHELFSFVKVGLGSLGVVTELTLRCIPKMNLHEITSMTTHKDIIVGHIDRLRSNRHVRYMWIPYTDAVVTVVSNPISFEEEVAHTDTFASATIERKNIEQNGSPVSVKQMTCKQALDPLTELYRSMVQPPWESQEKVSFSQMRDALLDTAPGPLDLEHVKKINIAEAGYWRSVCGERVADSTDVLGFDCGGQQLVIEVCFPVGRLLKDDEPITSVNTSDISFVHELLQALQQVGLPAPSPIEQRWTARSTARMSPAFSTDPDEIFSWVGVIMYLPPGQGDKDREEITREFQKYSEILQPLMKKYKAQVHWAKLEVPRSSDGSVDEKKLEFWRQHLKTTFPVDAFNAHRAAMDPHNILSNSFIDLFFGASPQADQNQE